MNTRTTARGAAWAAALAITTLLALPAQAQRVARDPLTGELRAPTATERKRMEEVSRKAEAARQALRPQPLRPIRLRDGSDQLEHDDSMLNYTVVRRAADGTLQSECTTGAELIARAATGRPASFAKNMMERHHDR